MNRVNRPLKTLEIVFFRSCHILKRKSEVGELETLYEPRKDVRMLKK